MVQTVAQASFDAWVKYYRQDENTPNATVSYYTKGALVALCLDLTLRAEGQTHAGRRDARPVAALPRRPDDRGRPAGGAGKHWAGRSFATEIDAWVHGTAELPLEALLAAARRRRASTKPAQLAQRLGLRVSEGTAVQIKTVLRGGAGRASRFCRGDEWMGMRSGPGQNGAWRLHKLDDLLLYAGTPDARSRRLVARDKRLLRLPLSSTTAHRQSSRWLLRGAGRHRVDSPWLSSPATRWLGCGLHCRCPYIVPLTTGDHHELRNDRRPHRSRKSRHHHPQPPQATQCAQRPADGRTGRRPQGL